ncbi:hypothetical protein [Streptomyces globisporus]|uniref:hypothetical protein n=1 Tax=Streptomyces globisporus TaxID=1908 RepID=UPI0036B9080F
MSWHKARRAATSRAATSVRTNSTSRGLRSTAPHRTAPHRTAPHRTAPGGLRVGVGEFLGEEGADVLGEGHDVPRCPSWRLTAWRNGCPVSTRSAAARHI